MWIYLSGCIIAFIIWMSCCIYVDGKVTLTDLIIGLVASILSWANLALFTCIFLDKGENIVLWQKKPKKKKNMDLLAIER